jgi:hypothetical protein
MKVLDSLIVSPILSPFKGPLDFSRKILFPEVVPGLILFERGFTVQISVVVVALFDFDWSKEKDRYLVPYSLNGDQALT